ncbi:2-dehydro-3-deoxy-6-phosphogalactonate aldolase [Salmonella enterica subsp. enterica]|uniref:2-dehydro-3-deoxy-6-phosphogalactonate aldolase n=1 Tax=Salmonella enterica I TaxID=59201 RepID=A0A447P3F8_SALET|nr:2-dehydro-3-deoxy-6-phosphogalactonate aldolase [Salmonella enterica subsp. enterica]
MQWQTNLPLIAILRGITPDDALAHVGAVVDAGFDAIEIPLNSPQWEKSISSVVKAYGSRALIGAGTVLKPEQVDQLAGDGLQAGRHAEYPTGGDPPGSELWHNRVSGLRHGNGSLCCAGCRRTGVKNFPVVGVWSGLHQRAESGTSAGCSAICRRRRDAGKPGAMD